MIISTKNQLDKGSFTFAKRSLKTAATEHFLWISAYLNNFGSTYKASVPVRTCSVPKADNKNIAL